MKFGFKIVIGTVIMGISIAVLFNNCSGFQANSNGAVAYDVGPASILGNPLPLTGSESYVVPITMAPNGLDLPTVSVTICVPGTNNCQTIDDILLDTGSTGLRIFSSVITLSLPTLANGNTQYGECYQFGSAMAFWGPVQTADVILGGEKATGVNLQSINSTYMENVPTDCSGADTSSPFTIATGPGTADFPGWNGIIGVQQFPLDCGEGCTPDTQAAIYYTCQSNNCTDYTMPTGMQVPNPIAALPSEYSNGFAVQIPQVPANGADSLSGAYLVLGIGTQPHNVPSPGVTVIPTDTEADFNTLFQGNTLSVSFMDTGSWDLSFPPPSSVSIATCDPTIDGESIGLTMYCPSGPVYLGAQMQGCTTAGSSDCNGAGAINLDFSIISGQQAWADPNNYIYNDIGDPGGGLSEFNSFMDEVFDWGLPVFFGKTVYFGMAGTIAAPTAPPGTPLGAGPFDAM